MIRCDCHGYPRSDCPLVTPDEWWVKQLVQDIDAGETLPHRRGACASCDEARRRRDPAVEQLPLGALA